MLQASSTSSLTHKLASLGLGSKEAKEHKRTFSLPGRGQGVKERQRQERAANKDNTIRAKESGADPGPMLEVFSHLTPCIAADSGLGWAGCPRLGDTPMLEPVVVKKIAHER